MAKKVVVTAKDAKMLADLIKNPPAPNQALKDLKAEYDKRNIRSLEVTTGNKTKH